VRAKIIKMDTTEKKIGLSIKAALDAPEDSVQSYQESQQGNDGSATLGDLVDPQMFRRGAPPDASGGPGESED